MFLLNCAYALEIATHFAFVPPSSLAGPPGPRVGQSRISVRQPTLVGGSSGAQWTHFEHIGLLFAEAAPRSFSKVNSNYNR